MLLHRDDGSGEWVNLKTLQKCLFSLKLENDTPHPPHPQ